MQVPFQAVRSEAATRPVDDLAEVRLEHRVRLLTGATPWMLHPLDEVGLRSIVVSDGPNGVRGVDEDDTASAQLPSPSAIAATWDLDLTARLGALLAEEAVRKEVDVILAPVVNLQRTPVGGRHFECFSEDPFLTARIAGAQIAAVQAHGVGMCVKHFIGNESETDRTSYVARIPEHVLREVYLAPFEYVVRHAGVWAVMAAYNQVDDGTQTASATEHANLLLNVLKGEWAFDGVVISDWLATTSTVESALAGLDVVMPGPGGPWEGALVRAVERSEVPETVIDDKVRRIIRLGQRVGAVDKRPSAAVETDLPYAERTRALLRETVARSIVVLRNDDLLPLRPNELAGLALIGPNALQPFVQGGGSAYVDAPYLSTPEQALRDALPEVTLTVLRGGPGRRHARPIDPRRVFTPEGQPGYQLQLFDECGAALGRAVNVDAADSWNRYVPDEAKTARVRAVVRLVEPGVHRIELGLSGAHRVRFDNEVVSESQRIAGHDVILDSSANHPVGPTRLVEVTSRSGPIEVSVDAELQVVDAAGYGTFVRFELRHEPNTIDAELELERAEAAARAADVAIVVVGTNEETESEGWDRQDLQLPARQNELVNRVSAANPRTVVVVNAGAPVVLPWLDQVAAVLWCWLPGQEAGNGLVDALLGVTEPSGRLPWTLPAREEDSPVPHAQPDADGIVDYAEGVDVGYRGWERLRRTPAREFGFGLGYATWSYGAPAASGWDGDEFVVSVPVENTSRHRGRANVQLYLESEMHAKRRPVRWLAGFQIVDLDARQSARADIRIPRRSFEIWDSVSKAWRFVAGAYRIRIGSSSRDLPAEIDVTIADAEQYPSINARRQ